MAEPSRLQPILADDLDAYPDDGNRYEVIDGALYVTPAPPPNHQRIIGALYRALHSYGAALELEVFFAPLDVRASVLTQVEPDLLCLPMATSHTVTTRWMPMSAVLLAVEVLSRSTVRTDRGRKRELYATEQIAQYWIVDPEARNIEVWTPNALTPRELTDRDTLVWQPLPDAPPLEITLAELFADLR